MQPPSILQRQIKIPSLNQLPAAYIVGGVFGIIWLAGVALGLPIILPTFRQSVGLQLHFFGPMIVGALLQLVLTVVYSMVQSRSQRREVHAFTMVRFFPLLVLAVFLYFNFKGWMPLVNPRLYDLELQRSDEFLAPILNGFIAIRQMVATLPTDVDIWYMLLFYVMFFMSFGVHSIIDTSERQRQFVLGLCLNLLIGGMSYWIMPALGPFLFREGVNPGATALQAHMLAQYQILRSTGIPPEHYFTAALGAMPSLHVGHSFFFTLWAAHSARPLLILYIPILFWIFIEAAATGWHYLLDLPAGAALAITSFALAKYLVNYEQAQGIGGMKGTAKPKN